MRESEIDSVEPNQFDCQGEVEGDDVHARVHFHPLSGLRIGVESELKEADRADCKEADQYDIKPHAEPDLVTDVRDHGRIDGTRRRNRRIWKL